MGARVAKAKDHTHKKVHHPFLLVFVRPVRPVVERQDRIVLREHGGHESRTVQIVPARFLLHVVDQCWGGVKHGVSVMAIAKEFHRDSGDTRVEIEAVEGVPHTGGDVADEIGLPLFKAAKKVPDGLNGVRYPRSEVRLNIGAAHASPFWPVLYPVVSEALEFRRLWTLDLQHGVTEVLRGALDRRIVIPDCFRVDPLHLVKPTAEFGDRLLDLLDRSKDFLFDDVTLITAPACHAAPPLPLVPPV